MQAHLDINYLYGCLLSSTTQRTNRHLKAHEHDMDGVLTWLGYVDDYSNEGSDKIRREHLEKLIQMPYDPTKHDSVQTFMEGYMTYVQELDMLYIECGKGAEDDGTKTCNLLNIMSTVPSMANLVDILSLEDLTYNQATRKLRYTVLQHEHRMKTNPLRPQRKAYTSRTQPTPPITVSEAPRVSISEEYQEGLNNYHLLMAQTDPFKHTTPYPYPPLETP